MACWRGTAARKITMTKAPALVGSLALALMAVTLGAASATPTRDSQGARNGEWIAYSTVPGDSLWRRGGPGYLAGSDVSIVRQGHEPVVVAGRGDGTTWNVCPAFSPDGTKLAFGTKSPAGQSVSVVRMTRAGVSAARRVRLEVRSRRAAPCPRWSADGSRLAYLRGGKVVVRGLDGASPRARSGDPVRLDFVGRHARSLISPAGDLVASERFGEQCSATVARADGSRRRCLNVGNIYAVAAWSPDGRRLLVMRDIGGIQFTMYAVSVVAPYEIATVVDHVRVNHPRSWPGRYDVSWQPRPS